MGTFTKPTLTNGNPFDPADVATGLDDIATAINGDVEDTNNFHTGGDETFTYEVLHPHTSVEILESASDDVTTFAFFFHGAAAGPIGQRTNIYGLPDMGLRLRLNEAALVFVQAQIQINFIKAEYLAATVNTYAMQLKLMNGDTQLRASAYVVENSDVVNGGITLSLNYQSVLASGVHDLWVELDVDSSTTTHATPVVSQASSKSRFLRAIVVYH